MEMWKTAAPPMENRYSRPDGKAASFPTDRKHRFPQLRNYDRLRTFPQRLLLLLKMGAITEMMMALILYNFRLNNKANYEADDVRSGTPYS